MTTSSPHSDELSMLLIALTDGDMDRRQFARLQNLLLHDAESQTYFRQYMRLCALLEFERAAANGEQESKGSGAAGRGDLGISGFGGSGVGRFGDLDTSGFLDTSGLRNSFPLPPSALPPSYPSHPSYPSLSPLPSPLSPLSVDGPVFSYIAATLILGVMLLSAWAYKITHDYAPTIVNNSRRSTTSGRTAPQPPEIVFVGRVTGMKDCRWADPRTETYAGAAVPLGRKYALSSGLMEITYRSGARVILEGPCSYQVESSAGGFLALGKLTAKVGKNSELGIRNSEKRMQANSQFPIPNSQFFSVRTPTAVVIDLGTEFGVEVNKDGNTTSYVFLGTVRVQVVGGIGGAADALQQEIVLHQNESARVEKATATGVLHLRSDNTISLPKFARFLAEPPKLLDLLDIVAGGNGAGKCRERGIDPATGNQDRWFTAEERQDDHKYHPTPWNPLVDGVFIPYVAEREPPTSAVQLDSSGHAFDGFAVARISNGRRHFCPPNRNTIGGIWSRAADLNSTGGLNKGSAWMYVLERPERYMPAGRGLLGIHANAGITFDLSAMRKMHSGVRPAMFRAVAGMGEGDRQYPDAVGMADLWIFIDGRLKWNRLDICNADGAIEIAVPIGPQDRFFTIVSTNGSLGRGYDWLVLGDPVLDTAPILDRQEVKPANHLPKEEQPMK